MSLPTTQDHLFVTIKTSLEEEDLVVDYFEGTEGLSIPFEWRVHVHAPFLSVPELLGTEIIVQIKTNRTQRFFTGIVGKIEQRQLQKDENIDENIHYQLWVYPKFWTLKFSKDYRIFQEQSTLDIILSVLNKYGVRSVDSKVSTSGQKLRSFCVQYGESPFDFVSRLMEEEGIFYYFQHTEKGHRMVLVDQNEAMLGECGNVPYAKQRSLNTFLNIITESSFEQQIVPKIFHTGDYNYLTPTVRLHPTVTGEGLLGHIGEFPGRFQTLDEGESYSGYRIQELEWPKKLLHGKGTTFSFTPGKRFSLTEHPQEDLNQDYFLYRVSHRINQRQVLGEDLVSTEESGKEFFWLYENEFSAIPFDIPFRAPRLTPKPHIYSHQTAVVTGPAEEEIFCDALGRIKIHFHWDVYNPFDESSSCWVRVAQNWAGSGWGGLVIPRIGMEVVVTFVDGDPDRPLVIGCVYHAAHTPPEYAETRPTCSTFKTNSSKKGEGGFNELRFDDQKGNEEIFMHAQKDNNIVIENDRNETIVAGNDTKTILKGNMSEFQEGDDTLHLLQIKQGDQQIHIKKGNFTENLDEGDHTQNLTKGNCFLNIIEGNHETTLDKGDEKTTLKKGGKDLTIEEGDWTITLSKGNQSLLMKSGDYTVNLKAGNLTITVNGDINVKANNITFNAKKNITIKAGLNIMLKAGQNIVQNAGKMITLKSGQIIKQESGQMINLQTDILNIKTKTLISSESLNIKNKAQTAIQSEAGAMYAIKSNTMVKIESGNMIQTKAGLMAKHEGGAMAVIKGAMTKIN